MQLLNVTLDPSLPRILRDISVCQQVGSETLDRAMNVLEKQFKKR